MSTAAADLASILDPGYLDGYTEKSLDDIRAMRAACQEVEVGLSYVRRVAQGRTDIVHRVFERKRAGKETTTDQILASMVDDLPAILSAGPGRPAGPGRLPALLAPDTEAADLTAELDAILGADELGHLGDLPLERLEEIEDALVAFEAEVSAKRRQLHERIDSLQAEIVRRYKTGLATVDGLLS